MSHSLQASFTSNAADAELDVNDPDFWKKLMPDAIEKPEQEIVMGPRQRKQTKRPNVEEDSDSEEFNELPPSEPEEPVEGADPNAPKKKKKRSLKFVIPKEEDSEVKSEALNSESSASDDMDMIDEAVRPCCPLSPQTCFLSSGPSSFLPTAQERPMISAQTAGESSWSTIARARMLKGLLLYGFGRWDMIRSNCHLNRTDIQIHRHDPLILCHLRAQLLSHPTPTQANPNLAAPRQPNPTPGQPGTISSQPNQPHPS